MKKFTIPCDFGGQKSPFDVYIGMPKKGNHPLQNQAAWLSSERGGNIPPEIMESFAKLLALSEENGVSFEELCVYALDEAQKKEVIAQKPSAPAIAEKTAAPQLQTNNQQMRIATAKIPADQAIISDPPPQAMQQPPMVAVNPAPEPQLEQPPMVAVSQTTKSTPKPKAEQPQAVTPQSQPAQATAPFASPPQAAAKPEEPKQKPVQAGPFATPQQQE